MLSFVSKNNPEVEEFTNFISHRITQIFGCDQVIFFDTKGKNSFIILWARKLFRRNYVQTALSKGAAAMKNTAKTAPPWLWPLGLG